MEDGKKLREFLEKSSIEQIAKLIDRLESADDRELNEYAKFLKSLFR